MKQGQVLLSHQFKAVSVDRLMKRPDLPSDTRSFLLLVEDIRTFSLEELGLKNNKNYTTFLDTGGDVLAYVVSACDPLSFHSYQWKYPFLGDMPYKGYYELEGARNESDRLKGEGLDVWVRGVDAFSTLGFFKDPLYGYMKEYPVHRLANLIIHEQTHATVWRKGDIPFNEDLASFVGDAGSRLYVADRYGRDSPEYRVIDAEDGDYRLFLEDIFALRDKLQALYETAPQVSVETLQYKKGAIISDFQAEFSRTYPERYSGDNYSGFAGTPVNNAYLELFHLYEGNREWFEKKYAAAGYDMKVFLASL